MFSKQVVTQTKIFFERSLKRSLLINLGEAQDQRSQLVEPEGRVLRSPEASLRFIKKRFRQSKKKIFVWATIYKKMTKMASGSLLLAMGIFLATVVGCSPIERFVKSAEPYRTEDYRRAFEKWTREARIYRGLDMELIVSATFKSADYRRAYAKEYAKTYLLSDENALDFEQDQLKAAEEFHDFVMATFIPDDKWNDFEKKDSIWKIYLTNDKNNRISPMEIKKLDRKDPVTGQFFPYLSPWRQVYSLRFPVKMQGGKEDFIGPDTRSITLTVTGVRGSCDMTWELKD